MINYSLEPKGDRFPLDGAQLDGDVYIRLEDTGDIRKVDFYLDDVLVQIAKTAPYLFNGATVFDRPRAAKFANGQHTIRAAILRRDDQTHMEAVSFRVGDVNESREYPVTITVAVADKVAVRNLTLTVDGEGNIIGLGGSDA